MPSSRFVRQSKLPTVGNKLKGSLTVALSGLDMVTSMELLKDGQTPDSKNFRLYAQSEAGREVAVSTRKGPGFYVEALGEALKQSESVLDGDVVSLQVPNILAEKKTMSWSGVITKMELNLVNTGAGILRIDIHADNDNKPGRKLSESSFTSISTGWNTLRFLQPVVVEEDDNIWVVIYPQDDALGSIGVQTGATGNAFFSHSSLLGLTQETYSIPFKLYGCDPATDKNVYRFNRESGSNVTLVPFNTTMYVIDESTHTYKSIMTGLSASATDYSFTDGDGSVFWTNGFDPLYKWNGTFEEDNPNRVTNPSFTTDTTGWTATGGGTGNAIARSTAEFHSTPASLGVSATSGDRSARYTLATDKGHRQHITFWAKGSGNVSVYSNGPNATIMPAVALTGTWTKYDFYTSPSADVTSFDFRSTGDFFLDDVSIVDTNIEQITDPELSTMSIMTFHKNRLMGVTTFDPNRIIFSEEPGNPTNSPADEQWYRAWLSVSFIDVPRPMNGSPITGIISFQDALTILTQDKKYILSGSDRGDYYLRESTGNKGALSKRGITSNANFVFFVGDDGIYSFNGSKDDKISKAIQPLFDRCPRKEDITLSLWKNQLRVYMASEFSPVNDICAILDTDYDQWMLDTKTFINRAVYYSDADDDMELVEFNSLTGAAYYAEQGYNALGGPIDFDYRLKYNSFGTPAQRKKIKKFFPLIQAVGSSFEVLHGMDKDLADAARTKREKLLTGGTQLGTFQLDGSVQLTGKIAYKPKKVSVSGNARTFQYRVSRNGVNNQVAFMGVQLTYKEKRL